MDRLLMLCRRLWHLANRRRRERELVREMTAHREEMADPSRFGDTYRLIERSRDAWGWNWLDDAVQDLSAGARSLGRSPGFAVTATLILTFGIGLNLTLYHIASVALVRSPAVRSPETLARLYRYHSRSNSTSVPYPLTQFVRQHSPMVGAVLVEAGGTVAWGADALEHVDLSLVSPNWFSELGFAALHGRVFSEAVDERPDAPPVAVLAYHFWHSRLGADPAVIGSTVFIDRRPFTVVGVAPPELPGLDFDAPAVFVPIAQRRYLYPQSPFHEAWDANTVALYVRLQNGVTPAVLRESLRATMAAAARERSEIREGEWLEPVMGSVNFMDERDRAGAWAGLSLIATLTVLVLIVASANVGNLVLSRTAGRVRELGVRVALGARRGRIIRQLVVEALPLAWLGAAGSVVFAAWTAAAIAGVGGFPPYLDFSPDWQIVLVSAALASIGLMAIGVLPAWKVAQQDLAAAMKDGGHQVSRALDRVFVRRLLVGVQVAGSCLLLVVAGMMVRGIQRLVSTEVGFEYAHGAVLSVPLLRYGIGEEAAYAYWSRVRERLRAVPDVEAAALVTSPPLGGNVFSTSYDDAPRLEILQQRIEGEYFEVMRIALLSGRTFAVGDAQVVIVSRRLAEAMYGSADVVGRGFPKSQPRDTIVGVAGDAHTIKVTASDVAELYRPLRVSDYVEVALVARGRRDPSELVPVLREAAAADPRVTPAVRLLRDDFERRIRASRMAGAIASGIGGVTLALACLGIFGVVSYGVALRAREIGIRTALGAPRGALLGGMLAQVTIPVASGALAGLLCAVPVGSALSGDPLHLRLADPVAFTAALLIFAGASAGAALWPAMLALRNNPVDALRQP